MSSRSTCSLGEPLVSSNTTSLETSTKPDVLLKTLYAFVFESYPSKNPSTALGANLECLPFLGNHSTAAPYTLSQGIICYKGRVWLGSSPDIQRQIISALHDSPIGGHSGFPVTYSKIKQLFYWKGMK
jgi:hypothetical protein